MNEQPVRILNTTKSHIQLDNQSLLHRFSTPLPTPYTHRTKGQPDNTEYRQHPCNPYRETFPSARLMMCMIGLDRHPAIRRWEVRAWNTVTHSQIIRVGKSCTEASTFIFPLHTSDSFTPPEMMCFLSSFWSCAHGNRVYSLVYHSPRVGCILLNKACMPYLPSCHSILYSWDPNLQSFGWWLDKSSNGLCDSDQRLAQTRVIALL